MVREECDEHGQGRKTSREKGGRRFLTAFFAQTVPVFGRVDIKWRHFALAAGQAVSSRFFCALRVR